MVAGTPTLLPTAIAASPAVSGPRPSWQQGALPVASLTDQDILSIGIAPTDGNEAYACFGTSDRSGATLTFYRTNDRSLHWTMQTHITVPSLDLSECMVQVDARDANRVLIEVTGEDTGTLNGVTSYKFTDNGGATWTQLNYSEMIYSPATFDGATYAMQYPSLNVPSGSTHLSVSTDGLQSWEPIDQAFSGPGQAVDNFWLNPDGEMLVEVTSGIVVATVTPSGVPTAPAQQHLTLSLWQSSDGGAHWEQIPTPRLLDGALGQDIVVQQPAAGEPWHMCERYGSQHGTSLDAVACTFDGGKTWSARPWLCLAALCTLQPQGGDLDVIASDGALLVMDQVPGNQSQSAIYRLPQGSTTWQSLGPISGSNAYFYAPTSSGSGVLYAYAGGTYKGRLSGIIGGQQSLPGVIAAAMYP